MLGGVFAIPLLDGLCPSNRRILVLLHDLEERGLQRVELLVDIHRVIDRQKVEQELL